MEVKENVLVISDHIFAEAVNVVFTDNINESIKLQSEYHKIDPKPYLTSPNTSGVVCHVYEQDYRATWVLFDINKVDEGVIVHEVIHIVFNILTIREINHVLETDEVFAYTTQWFFNKIFDFWNEITN